MKEGISILLVFLFISSCSPSENAVQTAIAETSEAPDSNQISESQNQTNQDQLEAPILTESFELTITPKPKVSCKDSDVENYLEELGYILEEWDDTDKRAGTTSRGSLSPVIGELQDIKRRTKRLEFPECGSYINDIVIVAMDRGLDSFLAFLGQEGDNIVARYMGTSEKAWDVVYAELDKFREDPLNAYEVSNITASSLEEEIDQIEPFIEPEDWESHQIPKTSLIASAPSSWVAEIVGDEKDMLRLSMNDGELVIAFVLIEDDLFAEYDSDYGRLFYLQTMAENQDYNIYFERDAYHDVFGINKGYVVLYGASEDNSFAEESIWAYIVTPDDTSVFAIVLTDERDFSELNLQLMKAIFESVRENQ